LTLSSGDLPKQSDKNIQLPKKNPTAPTKLLVIEELVLTLVDERALSSKILSLCDTIVHSQMDDPLV
jgi:hypothetical protein